jgi:uncharacterized protein YaiE (UPF0345 family)
MCKLHVIRPPYSVCLTAGTVKSDVSGYNSTPIIAYITDAATSAAARWLCVLADHCYVVNGSEAEQQQCSAGDASLTLRHMATLKHSSSGRVLELHGTQPGLQVHKDSTYSCILLQYVTAYKHQQQPL